MPCWIKVINTAIASSELLGTQQWYHHLFFFFNLYCFGRWCTCTLCTLMKIGRSQVVLNYRLLNQSFRFGYAQNRESILDIIRDRDCLLWNKIISQRPNRLEELLTPKRERKLRQQVHDYILPRIRTQRFKNSCINCCLF